LDFVSAFPLCFWFAASQLHFSTLFLSPASSINTAHFFRVDVCHFLPPVICSPLHSFVSNRPTDRTSLEFFFAFAFLSSPFFPA
jgi:hypothetical protein